MNILKAIEKLHYKLALVKEVLFNDARPVKPSLQDKDIDEITGRDKKIRELEAKKGKNVELPNLSSDECYFCGKKGITVQTCVKCKKAVCEDCATFVPETESEIVSGYYCQDCW